MVRAMFVSLAAMSAASVGALAIQECSSSSTVVARDATVELPEVFVRQWDATAPSFPGLFSITGFNVKQGGLVDVSVNFEVDGAFAKLGVPDAEPWCQEKGTHTFSIYMRGVCRASVLDDDDFEYYKFQGESQLGTDCGRQQLGVCRVLRVSKRGSPSQWVESQDGPEGSDASNPGGPGGSMEETGDGGLELKWGTCPDHHKIDYVIAHSLGDIVA